MARIGENIQAGLGRVDYSPLAQGIIAGGQARAQGIASLGQAASTAITAYFKRKEEDQRINNEIASLKSISQKPGGKAILEPLNIFKDDGSFDDATAKALIRERGLAGVVTLGGALKDLERQAKVEATNKRAIDYSSILEVGGGSVPAPYSNDFIKKGFTPEERALGKDIYVKQATAQANLDKARKELIEGSAAPTPAMRDADAIISGEIAAGMLARDPIAIAGRRAELIGSGGREPGSAYDNAGTYVLRKDQSNPITAVKNRKTGQIGVINKEGKFEVLDSATYMPITTSDANVFFDQNAFDKLKTTVVDQENEINALNRLLKNTERVSRSGIQRQLDSLSLKAKTILGIPKDQIIPQERALALTEAEQQQMLGAIRTTVLGPGVLTEIDAQRLFKAVGGDITSILTNVDLMQELLSELLNSKINSYDSNLDVYNAQVAGRYGNSGYKQRERVEAFIPEALMPKPIGKGVTGVRDVTQ